MFGLGGLEVCFGLVWFCWEATVSKGNKRFSVAGVGRVRTGRSGSWRGQVTPDYGGWSRSSSVVRAGFLSRDGRTWLEAVSRNVTSERARERGKGPAQQKRGLRWLRERVTAGLGSGNREGEHFCDGSDRTNRMRGIKGG